MKTSLSWKIDKILESEIDPAFARRAKIIFQNLEVGPRSKILDLGCGRGFYLKGLRNLFPRTENTGIDLNPAYLETTRRFLDDPKTSIVQGDAQKLPFGKNSFDRLIASEILEHLPKDQKALKEIKRVLKPGGIAMITVPNKNYPFLWDPLNWALEKVFKLHLPSHIWWVAGIWADHYRLYTEEKLKRKIKKAGLKILQSWKTTFYCFPFSHFLFYGIGKNLVEKGLFPQLNRFEKEKQKGLLTKLVQLPINLVDQLNEKIDKNQEMKRSVNLIFKISKPK